MGGAVFLLVIALVLYFLPTIVAVTRQHHQTGAVLVLNLFLGWTLVGWVVSLAMAASAARPQIQSITVTANAQTHGHAPDYIAPSSQAAPLRSIEPESTKPRARMLPEPPRAAAPSLDTIRAAIQRDEVPELDWPWRAFRIGVVGEGFINDDGTSRQEIIAGLHAGDGLELVCEPNNRYDKLAVKVCTLDHEQIGYLPAGHGLSLRVQNGRVGALIYRVTGGTHERPSRGVVALILEREA